MNYRFVTLDVFTDTAFGGNPLAVLPDARGLDGRTMQRIAREFNLSETVFVLPPDDPANTRKVRIFTPRTELPFAGHPTVGTAFALTALGEIAAPKAEVTLVLEEGVGPVPVHVRCTDGMPEFAQLTAAQPPEERSVSISLPDIAAVLSLSVDELRADELSLGAVSCGLPFLFVPLRSIDAVRQARLDHRAWRRSLEGTWAPQVFLFAMEGVQPGADLHARMFGPGVGIDEDPATGSAATGLAAYLATRSGQGDGELRWVVEQGFEMGRPSRMDIEAVLGDGEVVAARVGGASVMISEGNIRVA
ncbi:MAG TPA: PhzF family phenazine biosynthesis protein [Acidobacteriota bacterium]|nr:PhzF family phenazine biosynthesis protein [Acidobacteriota bacterium]